MLEIEMKHKAVLALSGKGAKAMARLTNGCAFAFQALDFLACRHDWDYKKALDDCRFCLEEHAHEKIWSELSPRDKEIVHWIAEAKSGKTSSLWIGMRVANYRKANPEAFFLKVFYKPMRMVASLP